MKNKEGREMEWDSKVLIFTCCLVEVGNHFHAIIVAKICGLECT